MSLVTLPRLLIRAPLLPVRALRDPVAALERDPLGGAAVELAGPGGQFEAALHRFARRAAFRPTPRALWAGVAVGELGARTRIATGRPRARFTLSWARLASLGRALLADAPVREQVRLRRAPSLLVRGGWALWMGPGAAPGPAAEAREAEVSRALAAVLEAAEDWAPWPRVRDAAARALAADDFAAEEVDVDDLLLLQIDDGLLCHDLSPPLVGPPPLDWMRARLARAAGAGHDAALLDEIAAALDAEDLRAARAALARARGTATKEPIHSVLVHDVRAATLSTDAVLRAASIAPLLLRLQDALAPPAREREADPAIGEAVDAVVETFGAGAYPLAPLALGDYGVRPEPSGERPPPPPPPAALLALLASRFASARDGEVRFTAEELDAVLPDAAPPPTLELVLSPCREPAGAPAGTDWLFGLHGPAGATWGRFAHALGEPLRDALIELARAERTARPGEARLDVDYAPSPSVADLATHPPLRDATLALTSWPDAPAVTPADLELVATAPLALRSSWMQPVAPSPLARLRSTTAPSGVYQLLAGWSLIRQHAPWALTPGPFADLDALPRVTVDGFVVAPRSWRIPDDVLAACRRGDGEPALRRWRAKARVPRHVQIGHEDELLPVDLGGPLAVADLARLAEPRSRAWEIWPPLDRLVDRDGRRVEAVVAVTRFPDEGRGPAEDVLACAAAGRVPPPDEAPAARGWRTYKLYGEADRQDRVLVGAVAPAVRAALAAHELDAWFFVRYVEPPGRREHLRVRVHARSAAGLAAFGRRLAAALAPARAACDVVAVDEAEYRRETARYGGPASLDALERVFQAESELACALLERDAPDLDAVERAVRAIDALAIGLGIAAPARRALARRRREATQPTDGDAFALEYRRRQRRLVAALAGEAGDPAATALARFVEAVRAAAPSPPDAALAPLLHVAVNRVAGTDAETEALVYHLWERALESVRARATPSPTGSRRRRRSS